MNDLLSIPGWDELKVSDESGKQEPEEFLREVFSTSKPVKLVSCPCSVSLNLIIQKIVKSEDKVIILRGGKRGEYLGKLVERNNGEPIYIDVEPHSLLDLEKFQNLLEEHIDARAILLPMGEPDSGLYYPLEEIAGMNRSKPALLVVDCVDYLGGESFHFDQWEIDIAIGGSKESILLPKESSMAVFSDKAEKYFETTGFYEEYSCVFDIEKPLKNLLLNPLTENFNSMNVASLIETTKKQASLVTYFMENSGWISCNSLSNTHKTFESATENSEQVIQDLFMKILNKRFLNFGKRIQWSFFPLWNLSELFALIGILEFYSEKTGKENGFVLQLLRNWLKKSTEG